MKPVNLHAPERRQRWALVGLLGVTVLAVMALMGYLIWSGYRESKLAAETTSRNFAVIIEARLDATLRRADADLQEVARTIPVEALDKRMQSRYAHDINAALDSRLSSLNEVAGYRVTDANGDILYTSARAGSRQNVSDRNYFRSLRDGTRAGLVFSDSMLGQRSGRHFIVIANALKDRHGRFGGIVYGVLELDRLKKLFQSLDFGRHGVVSIYRSDNFSRVVRWPEVGDKPDATLPPDARSRVGISAGKRSDTFEFLAISDGVPRFYSYQALDRYPFYVTVGFAREDVLAGWKARSLAVGLSGLLLLLVLGGLLYRLLRAESALRASEYLMRATFEQAPVGVVHTGFDRRYLLVNQKFCDMTGYTREELLGMKASDLIHPGDWDDRRVNRQRLLDGELDIYSAERRYVRKDGKVIWTNRTVSLARDGAGKPLYFIRVIEDITKRKQAEQALLQLNEELEARVAERAVQLLQSERRLAFVLAETPATIYTCRSEPPYAPTFISDNVTKSLGYSIKEFLGTPDFWSDHIHPDDHEGVYAGMARLFEDGKQSYEYRFRHKDGNWRWLYDEIRIVRGPDGKTTELIGFIVDITERKRTDETLQLTQFSIDHAADSVFWIKPNAEIVYVNDAACRTLGCAREELVGRSVPDIDPNFPAEAWPAHWEDLRRQKSLSFESSHFTKDGGLIRTEVTANFIQFEGQEYNCAFMRDITERKRAEETRSRLAAIVASSNDAIISRDSASRILSWNAAAERLFGYTAAEAIGQNSLMLVPPERTHEPGITRALLAQGNPSHDYDTVRLAKDGRRVDVSLSLSPIRDDSGATVAASLIFRDITERKRAEETQSRLAAIVATTNDAIISRSLDSIILSWNAAAERLLGYTAAEAIGQNSLMLIPPDRMEESERNRALVAQGKAVLDFETVRLAKHGRRVDVSLSHSPIRDANGATAGASLIFRDITERKRAVELQRESEERVHRLLRRLIDTQEGERRRLAADLHDLVGQNLSALEIEFQRLRGVVGAGDAAPIFDNAVQIIRDTTNSVREAITELHPELLDDFGVLVAIKAYVARIERLTGLSISIRGDAPDSRPPRKTELAVYRVVQEALMNAAKHAAASQVTVELCQVGTVLRLCVEDDGRGIDGVPAGVRRAGGWGMEFMRERAAALGGALRIESPGVGTRVIMEVPIGNSHHPG